MRGRHWCWMAAMVVLGLVMTARAADEPRQPVTAGSLTINPYHVVAVYRPVEHQAVVVYLARPGQTLQAIHITDVREAAAVFDGLWGDEKATKNPGESDGRPLTRMVVKDSDPALPTLIVNVERVLAVKWDANRRTAAVYIDVPPMTDTLLDPNTGQERDHLEISGLRRGAEAVVEAYKACVISSGSSSRDNK